MRVYDALTYHSCVAQADPMHYVCLLHLDRDKPRSVLALAEDGQEHVVLHIKCMHEDDHEYNSQHVVLRYVGLIGVYVEEENPYPGSVPCHRCKLY